MKKQYFTPEMEEFKYEIPTLFQTEEASGGEGKAHEEGGEEPL